MKDRIKCAVSKAFSTLKKDDGDLFDCAIEEGSEYSRKLHEVCINHRLAIYLEKEIPPIINGADREYFVDLEFNREGINVKKIRECNGEEILVRPDIIIHNRKSGGGKKNFLIVECKKKDGARQEEIDFDQRRIRSFIEDERYEYSFGLQVVYGKDKIKGTLFYKSGDGIIREEIITS
jgi:hypothetical protein